MCNGRYRIDMNEDYICVGIIQKNAAVQNNPYIFQYIESRGHDVETIVNSFIKLGYTSTMIQRINIHIYFQYVEIYVPSERMSCEYIPQLVIYSRAFVLVIGICLSEDSCSRQSSCRSDMSNCYSLLPQKVEVRHLGMVSVSQLIREMM